MTVKQLIAQVDSMPASELTAFRLSIVYASKASAWAGIISIFLGMVFANVFALICTVAAVYIAARMSINADQVLAAIDQRIRDK